MPDLVEVTSQGWLSRILASIKGVVVGGILILVSFPLLWANEGCAVRIAKGLAEGRDQVVEVPSTSPSPGAEGRLVHTTGRVTTATGVADPEFGLTVRDALRLERTVEMYQWVEKTSERTEKKLGGSEETVTETTYAKEWSSSGVDSTRFKLKEKAGEALVNPPMPMYWFTALANDAKIGVFGLAPTLVSQVGGEQPTRLDASVLQRLPPALQGRGPAQLADGGIYVGIDPGSPRIGDLRVRFEQVPTRDVSVVARLAAGGLGPWQTSQGTSIELLADGTKTAAELFAQAESDNVARTWALRLLGLALMWIGFRMIFAPLAVVADVVPFVGSLIGWGAGIVAFALALPLSLATVAVAWIAYRPALGITLLVVGGGVFVTLFALARRRRSG